MDHLEQESRYVTRKDGLRIDAKVMVWEDLRQGAGAGAALGIRETGVCGDDEPNKVLVIGSLDDGCKCFAKTQRYGWHGMECWDGKECLEILLG